jgi:hypothetical protein
VELDLQGTSVTDEGVLRLAELSSLRNLNVNNSRVTDAGVAKLKAARDDLKVVF